MQLAGPSAQPAPAPPMAGSVPMLAYAPLSVPVHHAAADPGPSRRGGAALTSSGSSASCASGIWAQQGPRPRRYWIHSSIADEVVEGSKSLKDTLSPDKGKGKAKSSDSGSSASLKGFAGGTVSGLTKLTVGHPFDTIKVRMQVSPHGTYRGPGDCFMQLVRKETIFGLYKGASPPAVGWAFTDSILMGSLHNYRLMFQRITGTGQGTGQSLPTYLHALSGAMAGWTNSLFTTPVELIKAKLQMQHQRVGFASRTAGTAAKVEYAGPIDCIKQITRHSGVKGLWHGLPANFLFRTNFAVLFGCYDAIHRQLMSLRGTRFEMSDGLCTFMAGGLGAELYWFCAFPADLIKNKMMADSLRNPEYSSLRGAVRSVWNQAGRDASVARRVRSIYTGFLPCLLRAFPTNAAALFAFEMTMRVMGAESTTNH